MGGSRRHLLELLSFSAKLSVYSFRAGDRVVPRRNAANAGFPRILIVFREVMMMLTRLARRSFLPNRSGPPPRSSNHSAHSFSLSHSVVSESLHRESRGCQAGNRPPGPPSAAARLCPLRPSSRLVPYFEEAVPRAGAHRHAVLRHPKTTDAVVVTR